MADLTRVRAERLLRRMRGSRVLVLGDLMLDEFIWGKVGRVSPEAPVPVVEVTGQSFHLGGAGNVAANLRSLGGEAVLVGVVGKDAAGERVTEALLQSGVTPALAVSEGARPTTVKTRIVAHHQQIVRADREVVDDLSGALEDALLLELREHLPGCRAVLVSDYQKGVVTPRVMKQRRAPGRGVSAFPCWWTRRCATFPATREPPWSPPTSSRPSRSAACRFAARPTCAARESAS